MTREITANEHRGSRQQWRTARALGRLIVVRRGIDLDAMALAHNAICERFIGPSFLWAPRRLRPLQPWSRWVPAWLGQRARNRDGELRECVALDALETRWALHGKSIFVNPPFAVLARAVYRAIEAAQAGSTVTMLAPDNGDTKWYAALVDAGARVLRFRGRVAYEPELGVDDGGAAGFPSALYELDAFPTPRAPGSPIPTFAVDPKTLQLL